MLILPWLLSSNHPHGNTWHQLFIMQPNKLQHIHKSRSQLFLHRLLKNSHTKHVCAWWYTQNQTALLKLINVTAVCVLVCVSVCGCTYPHRVASRTSPSINCQSLALMWQVKVSLLRWHWLYSVALVYISQSSVQCCRMNIQESRPHLAFTPAEMEFLWPKIVLDEDVHVA